MISMRGLYSSSLRRVAGRGYASTRRPVGDDDFRPTWVFTGSRLLMYSAIPLTFLYCALLADWGEREHVFMPLRRWVKDSMLTLSPGEAALARGEKERTE